MGLGFSTGPGRSETRFTTAAVVLLRPGEARAGNGPAYDARALLEQLQPVIQPPPS